MSVNVMLEKNGKIKNGSVGINWTVLFFGFWIPIFRGDFLQFIKMFALFILRVISIIFLKNIAINSVSLTAISWQLLLSTILIYADIWISFNYNSQYTKKLLEKGYSILPKDEFADAVLKEYGIFPCTQEEKNDLEKMERYNRTAVIIRNEERAKIKIFIGLYIFINIITIISIYFSKLHESIIY